MLYGHTSELAIRAALFLAQQPPGKLSTVEKIALGTGLPKSYLAKIIQKLVSAGLVRSFRGPGGGMELGRAPEAISLWSLVRAVEGPAGPEGCVLGVHLCSPGKPCPLHHEWVPLRNRMQKLLDQTTLAKLVGTVRGRDKAGEKPANRGASCQARGNHAEGDRRHAS